ncbi:FAD binding domain-containing protein [Diaporthe helianthi]|uniref:FAD binding domain-containing protein n=1 Tax=Diaporthe helianthi TaxID=158607 RepID=A0A2P5HIK8_DIAHE|nr:FAD binding domain-containing protein [Diaporthe helianthi]
MLPFTPNWLLNLATLGSYSDAQQKPLSFPATNDISGIPHIQAAVQSSTSCCEALQKVLGDRIVVFPSDSAYKLSSGSYFSLKNADLHPACIALPKSAEQVSAAVQTLTRGFVEWGEQCKFAIRGGGHTAFQGAASLDDGIVLHLGHLPAAGLSPDHKSIAVSPRQTWDQVTEQLDPYNLSTLGARVAALESFQVVLANGDIVDANADKHQDLWKALRGGGNNFGVVTSITLKTFPQGPFWGGQTFHDISTRRQHFEAHANFASAHPYDPYSHYINNLVLSNATRSWFIGSSLQYTKSDPPTPEPAVLKPFLDIPQKALFPGGPSNTIRIDNVTAFTREYAALATVPKRWVFATISFAPSAVMMEEFYQLADRTFNIDRLLDLAGFTVSLAYQPIPSVMSERHRAVDSLGPIQTQGNLVYVHLAVATDDEENDSDHLIEDTVQKFVEAAEKRAKSLGVHRSYLQGTYADRWQNPMERRSAGTLEELWVSAKKYDPGEVFQRQVPGGFKLPKI